MEDIITATLAATPSVIARVAAELPKDFPIQVFEAVTQGLKKAARILAAQPP
jgi:hypothetical protein